MLNNHKAINIRKTPLHPDRFYHIFNRGINGMAVFFEEKNYQYFLKQYAKYTFPFVETYAYCMLKNHYHILIRVRSEKEIAEVIKKDLHKPPSWHVSNGFSSFLQSYTRAINKMYKRTGALFETPFKRIEVGDEIYFTRLIAYIHGNPQKHKLVKDFRDYPFSSYHAHLFDKTTKLERNKVLNWFGGEIAYKAFHLQEKEALSERWMLED